MTLGTAEKSITGYSGHRSWKTRVPTYFVLAVLAALVLLPFVYAGYVESTRERMRRFAQPARTEVTNMHVALAREGALLRDFSETRDPELARRYREAVASEEQATRVLEPLTVVLGESVRSHFAEVRRRLDAWHVVAEAALRALATGGARSVDWLRGDEYEDLLVAVAHLDEAIGEETRQAQAHIVDSERILRWVSASLALLGLGAAGAVGWLARRLREHAIEAEQRRVELERVAEGRARLMRGVTHDLKNPMHAIDGHAQLLEVGILGPLLEPQQDSIARIRRSVRSMLALVDDLLELSRAEAGHLTVSPCHVDLRDLLHDTIEEHRAAAVGAGHTLELTIGAGPAALVTDPARVSQVLGNLISNAVKYTPRGGRIVVHAESRARDGDAHGPGWVAIDVMDDGPGIPEEQMATIFDEFARLARHAEKPGSGLGLSIARRIAALLGGAITVCAAQPCGARFTLWLPATSDTNVSADPLLQHSSAAG